MLELTINGKVYQFRFGMGFLKAANKKWETPGTNGGKVSGVVMCYANIYDGNNEYLEEALFLANSGQNPRITKEIIDDYIDDETTDIDELQREVLDFLERSNACKKEVLSAKEKLQEALNGEEASM